MGEDGRAARGRFATTHWSVVLAAGGSGTPASQEALATLCRLYWYPLYAFVRRNGHTADVAEDLVQAFFVRLLETQSLRNARAERGRFRSFLLASLKHFMINEYHRAHAVKRGGGAPTVVLDISGAEGRYALEPRDDVTPELLFERRWAQTLIERVQVRLRGAFVRSGKGALYERLKDFGTGDDAAVPAREIAAELGMSEGAVRVAVHRLRRRFRDLLREEIGHTVETAADVEEEIAFLLLVVSATPSPRASLD